MNIEVSDTLGPSGSIIKWKILFWLLLVILLYFITFAFAFEPVCVTLELVDGRHFTSRTGPPGVRVLIPRGDGVLQEATYLFYYPLHRVLKYKGWAWTLENDNIFKG